MKKGLLQQAGLTPARIAATGKVFRARLVARVGRAIAGGRGLARAPRRKR